MTGPSAIVLSILMITAFLLTAGGVYLVLKRKEPRKGALMIVAALVALVNVLIWTL